MAFAIGVLLTIIVGGIYPVFSVFLSDIINGLFLLGSKKSWEHDQGRRDADTASLVFLILAIGGFGLNFTKDVLTYVVGD